jgi:prepilin-type N-terminal cleavage/methylation domain-containing protein
MIKDKGFTLTELLVVVGIIGILAGIIFVSGGTMRQDARDKKRKADIEQLGGLLQLKLSQTKTLPTPQSYNEGSLSMSGTTWDTSYQGDFLPFLVTEGYTLQISRDPRHPSSDNFYQYTFYGSGSVGTCQAPFFAIIARLEGQGNSHPCFPTTGFYTVIGN